VNPTDVAALLAGVAGELGAAVKTRTAAHFAARARPLALDVVAMGKAVSPMVEALLPFTAAATVILPDGAPAPRDDPRIRVLRAAHPLPDARSVAAGEAALALAEEGRGDELCVVVSGGASSLAFVPVDGVSLDAARAVVRVLLHSGADVRAINVVRRHLSRVHGGGLLRATKRPVHALLASDVLGGAPHDIGSGPAVFDPTTVDDARAVLARYAPQSMTLPFVETRKPEPGAQAPRIDVLLEPTHLADAAARRLAAQGYAVRVLRPSTDDVDALAAEYTALASTLRPREACVRVAEPSVHVAVARSGRGGRSTHLAALVARDLPAGCTCVAAASDGVDGDSETAGAVVTHDSFPDRDLLARAIAAFDTGPLHGHARTALPMAPTGLNLTDLHLLIRD
jgi:hydroxypyruvate reductase